MTQPINLEDIPEIAYPRDLMLSEPPVDHYALMIYVDSWATEQTLGDFGLSARIGLTWLSLDEQARLDHCENYLGAVQDRAQNARED